MSKSFEEIVEASKKEKLRLEFLRLQNPEEDTTAEEYEEYQRNWMNEHTND